MWMLLVMAPSPAADWEALEAADWRDRGTRKTSAGEVELRASWVDAVGCVEGRATVAVGVPALAAVADDLAGAGRWSSAPLVVSEEIARDGATAAILQLYDAPAWTLVADRYWVFRGTSTALPGGAARYRWDREPMVEHPDHRARILALSPRAIEPPVSYGEWRFTPGQDGTAVRYRACADLGGTLPAPVQRWVSTQQVPTFIAEVVAEAARREVELLR